MSNFSEKFTADKCQKSLNDRANFFFYIAKKQKFYKSKCFLERNLTFANVCELNFPLQTLSTLLDESKSFL